MYSVHYGLMSIYRYRSTVYIVQVVIASIWRRRSINYTGENNTLSRGTGMYLSITQHNLLRNKYVCSGRYGTDFHV